MNALTDVRQGVSPAAPRAWSIVAALSVTETVSWGVVYYAFAVFLVPMQRDLGYSTAQLTGAFSIALLIAGVAGIPVGRHIDARGPRLLMTAGSIAATLLVVAWSQVHSLAAV
jgi:MFS family permease